MDPPLNFNLLMDLLGFDAEDHDFDLDLVPHAAIDDDVYIDMDELFADAVVDDDLDLEAFLDAVIDSDTTTIPGAVNAEKLMADFRPEKGCDLGDCSICLETLHQVAAFSSIYSHLFPSEIKFPRALLIFSARITCFFGPNSYSLSMISPTVYYQLLDRSESNPIYFCCFMWRGEDNCIWKGSSSGVCQNNL